MNTNVIQARNPSFAPHRLVRSGGTQTMLARYRPRRLLGGNLEQPLLLDAGPDVTGYAPERTVRLLGYYTPAQATPRRGLVLTLHGWEGCSHSTYNLILTDTLIRAGYDVVRLNLRDHGPGLHVDPYALNPGLFLGTLIDETATAVGRVAAMAGDQPFYIVGASMGGSFALRLAIRHATDPLPNLCKVIAFNPPINPLAATYAIDTHRVFRHYFRRRWLQSLLTKQRLFPDLHDFASLINLPLITQMTDWIIRHADGRYGDFANAKEYFNAYRVTSDALQSLTVPTTIITAQDDPVIPVADFYALAPHPLLDVQIHATGGHVGFVDIFPLRHRLPTLLLDALEGDEQ
ncbi:MAG: alpha/beta fold hydrolase [Chloroflexota bacterium]|nr:alpha/beta fold hydrolase [Chloroflexota bacterium]